MNVFLSSLEGYPSGEFASLYALVFAYALGLEYLGGSLSRQMLQSVPPNS